MRCRVPPDANFRDQNPASGTRSTGFSVVRATWARRRASDKSSDSSRNLSSAPPSPPNDVSASTLIFFRGAFAML